MDRVRESIEATPWPTLVRVAWGVAPATEEGGKGEDCRFTAVAVGKSVEEGWEGAGGHVVEKQQQQQEEEEKGKGEGQEAEASGRGGNGGNVAAADTDDLEALFDRIRAIRQSALHGDGISGDGDEERRARASMAALELARVLGLDDGEDNDDD